MRGDNPLWTIEDDLDRVFTYQPPRTSGQIAKYERVRWAGRVMAQALCDDVPDSDERDEALKRIREAVMWANAGIALSE